LPSFAISAMLPVMTDEMRMSVDMTDMDTTAVTVVTVDEAADLAGVSARTIRRWIQRGILPSHTSGDRGKLVAPGDLRHARQAARGGHGQGQGHGHDGRVHDRGSDHADMVMDTPVPPVSVSPSARSQLESIRDEWLQPLIDQIGALQFDNGRLTAERDAAARTQADAERERLEAERARRDDASQADQLVNLLEDRIRELEARLGTNDTSGG
jgi:excisionase family DNA binding protein